MYKPRESDLLYARMALLERLATPAEVQRALKLLRRITEAGGQAPQIGEIFIGQGNLTGEQHEKLLGRMNEVNEAITDAQSGLYEVPRRLGRYEVLERIGRGGMGVVYKARQLNMDRVVALKILAAHLTRDRKYIKQFIREARAAGQISHPNIVEVHEVGQAEGHFFICMEHVEGRPLSRELLARGRLEPAEALEIGRKVASALAAAEKRKIVHRDIKPDNIILTPRGDIKVTDLGLAKRLADVTSASQSSWGCGTPYYMAPEQARNSSKVDIRSDIYALGSTLYHLVTGKLPFEGPSSVEVLMRAATDRLIPPSVLCPEVPLPLSDLIERMMFRDPDGRPTSALALIGEMDQVRGEMASEKGGQRLSQRSKRLRAAAASLLGGSGPAALIQAGAWSLAALVAIAFMVRLARRTEPEMAPRLAPRLTTIEGPDEEPPASNGGGTVDVQNPPPDAGTRKLLRELQSALSSGKPLELRQALARCEEGLRRAGGLAPALRDLRAELVGRMELLAGRELARRRYLAEEALLWVRPGRALELVGEVERRWPGTAAARGAAALRARLSGRAGSALRRLSARFEALMAAERFDRAEDLLELLREEGFPKYREWWKAASGRVPPAREAAAERLEKLRAQSKTVGTALAEAERLMARWSFGKAAAYLESASRKTADARTRRRLQLARGRAAALLGFHREVCKQLKNKTPPVEDSSFRKAHLGLVVKDATDAGLVLVDKRGRGVRQLILWWQLSQDERVLLARQVSSRRRGSDQLGLALLCATARRMDEAESYLRGAEKLGVKVADYRSEFGLMASGGEEQAAEDLETRLRKPLELGRPAEALPLLGRLLVDRRRTAYVAARREVLEALVREAERDCVLVGPFSGSVRETLPGCLSAEYDFSSPAAEWRASEDSDSTRLEWAPVFAGEFRVVFEFAGLVGRAALVLKPVAAPGAVSRMPALRLESAGPRWAGRELSAAELGAAGPRRSDVFELAFCGGAFEWGTPACSGRAAAPAELLDDLASGRSGGWRLALDLPAGSRASSARIDCRLAAGARKSLRAARALAAEARLAAARRVADLDLRLKDLERLILGYRDVAGAAGRAELERAAALLALRRIDEARRTIERFLATYPSQPELFPAAREILNTIGGAAATE